MVYFLAYASIAMGQFAFGSARMCGDMSLDLSVSRASYWSLVGFSQSGVPCLGNMSDRARDAFPYRLLHIRNTLHTPKKLLTCGIV